jgi:hypothetical protein
MLGGMIPDQPFPRRSGRWSWTRAFVIVLWLALGSGAVCAAALTAGRSSLAAGASDTDCRQFHEECAEATVLGYRDVGICHVERLECSSEHADEPDAGADEPQRPTRSGVQGEERRRP